ncbi:dTDP-4-dehydrorhamnose reductase [Candidatus Kuenenbacteria bacterium]|nr:dTDP-4-dehydrorhamnose reductase [Candidatus Kuenenbacteria bacterium]
MKLLIIGSKGMLGQELAKVFSNYELTLWDREELDITDEKAVNQKIRELQPELIINSAAYNAVDDCEEKFELAKKINHQGPINLAKAANKVGAFLIHYSTDYVFDGQKQEGYLEYDLPAPISKYGESKYLGEEILEHNDLTFLIRTSRLFGKSALIEGAKKSFVEIMLKLADEKEELDIVDEEVSSPTYVVDLAEQTKLLVEGDYAPGIYHVTNEGACTWCEFACEIFERANKTVKINPVACSVFPRSAKRPMFSSLINSKLPKMRSWQDALQSFLDEIGAVEKVSAPGGNKVDRIEKAPEIHLSDGFRMEEEKVDPAPLVNEELVAPESPVEKVFVEHVQQVEQKINVVSNSSTHSPRSFAPTSVKTTAGRQSDTQKNMKGIILAGGKGTRLHPLTKITSKQLLTIYNKPMVMYPLETLIKSGIKDILIIVAPEYAGQYLQLLGSGKEWGVKITYEIQDAPKGLPEAFIIGENFIGDDNVTLILGDNLFFDHDFTEDIKSFDKGGRIFAVEVPDPERFGVVEFDINKQVLSIEEKPKEPKSNYAIPGIYIFDSRVANIAKGIKPTWRPETDITEVHKAYLTINELDVRLIRGRWLDTGTFESLLQAGNIVATLEYQKKMGFNTKISGGIN